MKLYDKKTGIFCELEVGPGRTELLFPAFLFMLFVKYLCKNNIIEMLLASAASSRQPKRPPPHSSTSLLCDELLFSACCFVDPFTEHNNFQSDGRDQETPTVTDNQNHFVIWRKIQLCHKQISTHA